MHSAHVLYEMEHTGSADARSGESEPASFHFGPFELRTEEQLLLRDGSPVVLSYRAIAVLDLLLRRAGHVVEKTDLLSEVWKDCYVEEGNLTVTVSAIRKALGDPRNEQRYIKTVSGHGYRFVGSVRQLPREEQETTVHAETSGPVDEAGETSGRELSHWRRFRAVGLTCLLVLAITGVVVRWLTEVRRSDAAMTAIHSMAILPFTNESPGAEQSKLNIEVTNDLIDRLGEDGSIEVRPMESVLKYVNRASDPVSAGREQKVDSVLTGTVAALDGHVKVSAQLVKVNDGSVIWHGAFDKPLKQTIDLEDQFQQSLARQLLPDRLDSRMNATGTYDPEAHRLYLEGLYFWNKKSKSGIERSIEDFQAATLKDPGYALAYAGLADSYTALAIHNIEPAQDAYPNAQAAAEKALQLNHALAEPHATLGKIALYYEWNPAKAEGELRRAIQLNPSSAVAHAWYAADLAAEGKLDGALREALRAEALDPVSPSMTAEAGRIYYWNRQYDQAIIEFRRTIDLNPEFPAAYYRLGATYLIQKKYSDAIREFRQAKQLFGGDVELDGLLGYAEASSGNTAAARRILDDLRERSGREYVPAYSTALIYVALGDHAMAREWLAKCKQERPASLVFARIDPLFDPMRSDGQFSSVLTDLGLTQSSERMTLASIR